MDIKKERIIDSIVDYLKTYEQLMFEFILERTEEYTLEDLVEMDDSLIEYELKGLLEWKSKKELNTLSEDFSFITFQQEYLLP
jgi:hypothetical protein